MNRDTLVSFVRLSVCIISCGVYLGFGGFGVCRKDGMDFTWFMFEDWREGRGREGYQPVNFLPRGANVYGSGVLTIMVLVVKIIADTTPTSKLVKLRELWLIPTIEMPIHKAIITIGRASPCRPAHSSLES